MAIGFDLSGRAAALPFQVTIKSARTGVHCRHEYEAGRKGQRSCSAGYCHSAILSRIRHHSGRRQRLGVGERQPVFPHHHPDSRLLPRRRTPRCLGPRPLRRGRIWQSAWASGHKRADAAGFLDQPADRREAAQREIDNFTTHRKRTRNGLYCERATSSAAGSSRRAAWSSSGTASNSPACSGGCRRGEHPASPLPAQQPPTSKPPICPSPHPRRPPVQSPPLTSILILVLHPPPCIRKFHRATPSENRWS